MSTHPTDTAERIRSNNLNRQVGLYSLAAAVAGVSMLALAEPAQAEVVVTKKAIPVPITPWPVKISIANNGFDIFYIWRYSLASDRGLLAWGGSVRNKNLERTIRSSLACVLPSQASWANPNPEFLPGALW